MLVPDWHEVYHLCILGNAMQKDLAVKMGLEEGVSNKKSRCRTGRLSRDRNIN